MMIFNKTIRNEHRVDDHLSGMKESHTMNWK